MKNFFTILLFLVIIGVAGYFLFGIIANNKDAYLFRIGHASSATGDFSNNYALLYEGTGSSPNNCLILKTSKVESNEINKHPKNIDEVKW